MWDVASSMRAIAFSMWAVTFSMGAIIGAMWAIASSMWAETEKKKEKKVYMISDKHYQV